MGIRSPLFASSERGAVAKKLRSKRFEMELDPVLAHGQISAKLFAGLYAADEISPEEMLKRHPDLAAEAKIMLKGGITWKGKARTMVNMQGENVKARAYVISYDPPKGAKRPFRRLMVPFYRLQNAFDNKGAVAVHHGGTSRYQGISLSEKREKLSDGGETTVTRAGEFALWEVPFRSKKGKAKPKPKFWAARENGMIVTDDDNKPLYPSDDKGHELFVEVDPKKLPIVVVFEGASYPALIGYNYPDMCRILRPTLELIAGGPLPDKFDRSERESFEAADASEYIEEDADDEGEELDDDENDSHEEPEASDDEAENFEPAPATA